MSADFYTKERFKAIGSVYAILVNQQGQVLLSRRCNTGYCDGQYGLPAGHLEAGESIVQGLIREEKEEIGIEIKPEHAIFVHLRSRNQPDGHRIDYFFEVRVWSGEIKNCEPDKCDELIWVSPKNLPSNTIPYIRDVLDHWQTGERYSEEGWAIPQFA